MNTRLKLAQVIWRRCSALYLVMHFSVHKIVRAVHYQYVVHRLGDCTINVTDPQLTIHKIAMINDPPPQAEFET